MKFASLCFLATVATVSGMSNCLNTDPDDPAPGEYMFPLPSDSRSPCPIINTLANHGCINRDGRAIPLTDLRDELVNNFPVVESFPGEAGGSGPINAAFNAGLTYELDGEEVIDLESLHVHNALEHDASFIRSDFFFGYFDALYPDPDLVKGFLQIETGEIQKFGMPEGEEEEFRGTLTMQEVMDWQSARHIDSALNNPLNDFEKNIEFSDLGEFTGEPGTLGGAAVQATLIMAVGQVTLPPARQDYSETRRNIIMGFLGNERFPDTYEYDPDDYPEDLKVDLSLDESFAGVARTAFLNNLKTVLTGDLSGGDGGGGCCSRAYNAVRNFVFGSD